MAKKALARVAALVGVQIDHEEDAAPCVFRDCDPSEQGLFQGKDEVGREGWWLRLEVTGMYTRRCGPFESREEALGILDEFASKVAEGFIDVSNALSIPERISVLEGVPRLMASAQ